MFNQKILLFSILIITNSSHLSSLDLTTNFNIGNFGFSKDINSSAPGLIWGTSVIAEQEIDSKFLFTGKLIIDDVSGNRIDSRLTYSSNYFRIGIGPSLASINNGQFQLKPAINGFVEVKKDGWFKLGAEIYSTIGNLSDSETDYSQLSSSLFLGLNIPGAICTFSFSNKQFSYFNRDASSIISKTTDLYSVYQLETDIHKKNIPFHLIFTVGYKSNQRLYPINDPGGRIQAGIGSAFIGIGTRINIGKKILVSAGMDSGLYNFSLSNELSYGDLPVMLFNVFASFKYIF